MQQQQKSNCTLIRNNENIFKHFFIQKKVNILLTITGKKNHWNLLPCFKIMHKFSMEHHVVMG